MQLSKPEWRGGWKNHSGMAWGMEESETGYRMGDANEKTDIGS